MIAEFKTWYSKYASRCIEEGIKYVGSLHKNKDELSHKVSKALEIKQRASTSALDASILNSETDNLLTRLADAEESIDKINSIIEETKQRAKELEYKKVYKKLQLHPKIEEIKISGESLQIVTKNLKVKSYDIGKFCLEYTLPNKIKIYNLTYRVNGRYDHWHVQNGDPCLDSRRPIMWRYIDTFQLFLFIDTLFHYLLLSQSEHAYMPFEEWIKRFTNREAFETAEQQLREQAETDIGVDLGRPLDSTEFVVMRIDDTMLTTQQSAERIEYTTSTYNNWIYITTTWVQTS